MTTTTPTWGAGTWGSAKARRKATRHQIHQAVTAANNDPARVYFDETGTIWVLNHTRAEACPSLACPACNTDHPAHVAAR